MLGLLVGLSVTIVCTGFSVFGAIEGRLDGRFVLFGFCVGRGVVGHLQYLDDLEEDLSDLPDDFWLLPPILLLCFISALLPLLPPVSLPRL